jgi:hypothetical protein
MPELNQVLLLQAIGGVFILLGLAARFGFYRKWYWASRGGAYAYIPMGLMFVLFTFNEQAEEAFSRPLYYAFLAVFGLLAILCVWWSQRPPAFIQPRWVRWIEKHPRRIIQAMKAEVEAGESWEELTRSEERIDEWARSLRGKLPRRARK